MSKSVISIYVLLALVFGTNAMWLYRMKHEVSPRVEPITVQCTKTEESTEIYDSIVLPLTDAIAAASKPGASRESIIQSASSADFITSPICMEDPTIVRVRGVGLQFNESGQLTGATVVQCPP